MLQYDNSRASVGKLPTPAIYGEYMHPPGLTQPTSVVDYRFTEPFNPYLSNNANLSLPPPQQQNAMYYLDYCGNYAFYEQLPPHYMYDDPRCFRRRVSANKKERRRTQSINNAFSNLRDCIPNVPVDTKLSKIKTLRLATRYIEFLMNILETNDGKTIQDFKADLGRTKKRSMNKDEYDHHIPKKIRCRTGWPHDVWVNELNGN